MNQVKSFTHILLFLTFMVAQQPNLFYSSFTTNDFTTDDGWKILNIQSGNVYSNCRGIRLLGGYNLFGEEVSVMKMFQLPPHYQVKVKFQFWKIDSWNNEYFYFYIDQQQIEKLQFEYEGINECGNGGGWNEKQSDIDITVSHDYPSILIYMTTNLDSLPDNESWGIRDFYLYLYQCPPGCLTCEENDQIIQCIPWLLLNSAFISITQSQFNYDGWIINNSYQQTSLCGNIPLFGGYQVTGKNSIIQTTIVFDNSQFIKNLNQNCFY